MTLLPPTTSAPSSSMAFLQSIYNFFPILLCSQLTTPLQPLPYIFIDEHSGHFRPRHSLALSLQPGVPAPFHYLCCFLTHHMPTAHSTLLPYALVPCPPHPYTFSFLFS
jgi:hypothetical protein